MHSFKSTPAVSKDVRSELWRLKQEWGRFVVRKEKASDVLVVETVDMGKLEAGNWKWGISCDWFEERMRLSLVGPAS